MGGTQEVRRSDGPGGMIYTSSFTAIGVSIQVILRSLTQQFQRLQCWYYCGEGFIKYAADMASGGMI
jgi:hypothetical protein